MNHPKMRLFLLFLMMLSATQAQRCIVEYVNFTVGVPTNVSCVDGVHIITGNINLVPNSAVIFTGATILNGNLRVPSGAIVQLIDLGYTDSREVEGTPVLDIRGELTALGRMEMRLTGAREGRQAPVVYRSLVDAFPEGLSVTYLTQSQCNPGAIQPQTLETSIVFDVLCGTGEARDMGAVAGIVVAFFLLLIVFIIIACCCVSDSCSLPERQPRSSRSSTTGARSSTTGARSTRAKAAAAASERASLGTAPPAAAISNSSETSSVSSAGDDVPLSRVAGSSDGGNWTCSQCTFINVASNATCEMCTTPKGGGAAPQETEESSSGSHSHHVGPEGEATKPATIDETSTVESGEDEARNAAAAAALKRAEASVSEDESPRSVVASSSVDSAEDAAREAAAEAALKRAEAAEAKKEPEPAKEVDNSSVDSSMTASSTFE